MMKRISKFKENALQDPTGIPLALGVAPELQQQRWAELSEDIQREILYNIDVRMLCANPVGIAGEKPSDWRRVIDQFEREDSYLLIVEGFALQLVKKSFGGYWVRANCAIAIIDVAKDYSESCWTVAHAYNWWWQRQHPVDESQLQYQHPATFKLQGVSDIQLESDNSLTFHWATRGLMRLTILPERKLGFTWVNYNALMLNSFFNMARSNLRLRRVPEWRWPNSRTLWGAWRRFFEMTIRHAGPHQRY